ncbi:MAG TPA: SgcJ/EcaC family oxidoreductase [Longimicrobium sp.]|jgi:uncharacterized protein (TIGR02246 family)
MKRTSRTRAWALLVALSAAACATPPAGAGPVPQNWSADEAQIRAAMQASSDAWNRGDLKGHLAIYVDSVTFMTRNGPRPGVAAIEQSFTQTFFQGGQPKQNLRFEQMAVRPLGPGSALGTGRFILSGGGQPDATGWFTLVWVRTADGWRAVHDHSG